MSPILGIWASSFNAGGFTPTGSYDALATYTVPSGGVSTITFAGLPTGGQYTHLQIRASYTTDTGATNLYMNINSNGSTYYHYLFGDGSSATAGSTSSNIFTIQWGGGGVSQRYGLITDILDFASSTKNKTIRTLGGIDNNGSGGVFLSSNLYATTSAISSITIGASYNLSQYSTFSLYGVKG